MEAGKGQAVGSGVVTPRALRLAVGGVVAASVAVAAQIIVPIPPVPFTLQTAAIGLAGLLLPPGEAFFAILVYLGLGTFLPVFSGFKGGLGVLFGPTGGFLLSFPLQAALGSWLVRRREEWSLAWMVGCQCVALVPVFLMGWAGLVGFGGFPPARARAIVLPFLPGGFLKAILAAVVYRAMAPGLPAPYRHQRRS